MPTATGVSVTTTGTINPATGNHAQGLYNGNGGSSGIGPTGGGVAIVTDSTFLTKGVDAIGVDTLNGGRTTVTGGSVTTEGVRSAAVVADSSAFVSLTGTFISTTGAGSTGIGVNDVAGAVVKAEADANNATITTAGGVDSASGHHSNGVYNGPSGAFTSGGIVKLTNSTIATGGAGANGVVTEAGGSSTTVSGGSIATTGGPDANAFVVTTGATAQITGTTLTASANGSKGVVVTDSGTMLTASGLTVTTKGGLDPATGLTANAVYSGPSSSPSSTSGGTVNITNSTITTTGNDAAVVVAESGGVVNLAGSKISATGALGSSGLVTYDGGQIDATNVTVTTLGGFDSATGRASYGVANDPFGSFTTGGVAKITDSSISTQGAGMYGVLHLDGRRHDVDRDHRDDGGVGAPACSRPQRRRDQHRRRLRRQPRARTRMRFSSPARDRRSISAGPTASRPRARARSGSMRRSAPSSRPTARR